MCKCYFCGEPMRAEPEVTIIVSGEDNKAIEKNASFLSCDSCGAGYYDLPDGVMFLEMNWKEYYSNPFVGWRSY
jgi:hypothetical protein